MEYNENQTAEEHNKILFDKVKKLDLPNGQYAIVSGGPLAIRGLRKTHDIDVMATPVLWEELKKKYGTVKYDDAEIITPEEDVDVTNEAALKILRGKLPEGQPTVKEQIDHAEIIDGMSFQTLRDSLWFKKNQGREKDQKDLIIVKEYLDTHPEEKAKFDFDL